MSNPIVDYQTHPSQYKHWKLKFEGPVATLMAESAVALRSKYLATGKATEADIDDYIGAARNPASWAIYYSTVAVIARKAGG